MARCVAGFALERWLRSPRRMAPIRWPGRIVRFPSQSIRESEWSAGSPRPSAGCAYIHTGRPPHADPRQAAMTVHDDGDRRKACTMRRHRPNRRSRRDRDSRCTIPDRHQGRPFHRDRCRDKPIPRFPQGVASPQAGARARIGSSRFHHGRLLSAPDGSLSYCRNWVHKKLRPAAAGSGPEACGLRKCQDALRAVNSRPLAAQGLPQASSPKPHTRQALAPHFASRSTWAAMSLGATAPSLG